MTQRVTLIMRQIRVPPWLSERDNETDQDLPDCRRAGKAPVDLDLAGRPLGLADSAGPLRGRDLHGLRPSRHDHASSAKTHMEGLAIYSLGLS